MKNVILFILGALFTILGFSGWEEVYVSLPALIAATMALGELLNSWRDWHGWKASLSVAAVGVVLSLIGYGFQLGYFVGITVEQLLIGMIIMLLIMI